MFYYFTSVAVPFLASVAIPGVLPFSVLPPPPVKAPPFSIIKEFDTGIKPLPKTATERPTEKRLVCTSCSHNEKKTLDFLQDKGIKDKNALATVMGNIKQESGFAPDVCEGGSRTHYSSCGGGYGLIQFTSANRYYGLGRFAKQNRLNPSTLEAQLSYIVTEPQWKQIETSMKSPGRSIYSYMRSAYDWIGWGIHGNRTKYAYSYSQKIQLES